MFLKLSAQRYFALFLCLAFVCVGGLTAADNLETVRIDIMPTAYTSNHQDIPAITILIVPISEGDDWETSDDEFEDFEIVTSDPDDAGGVHRAPDLQYGASPVLVIDPVSWSELEMELPDDGKRSKAAGSTRIILKPFVYQDPNDPNDPDEPDDPEGMDDPTPSVSWRVITRIPTR